MIAVADSSCLIALAMVDMLWLLPLLFSRIVVPEGVYEEVVVRGRERPGSKELAEASWFQKVKVPAEAIDFRTEGLGKGEIEVLAVAKTFTNAVVLTDDELAWRVAEGMGVPYMRTVELILVAACRGLIEKETAAEKIVELGQKRWIHPNVVAVALSQLERLPN